MPWKKDENGFAQDASGNPVWVAESGEEKAVDYAALSGKLSKTAAENMQRKDELNRMKERYGWLEEVEDLPAWRADAEKALEMMRNASDSARDMEEQVRQRIEAATRPLQNSLETERKQREDLQRQLEREAVGNAFARSVFVNEKCVNPALVYDLLHSRFRLHDGQVVAVDDDGKPIYGAEGYAKFDEALPGLLDKSPYKAHLLKGSQASGSGATPGNGAGGHSIASRKQFKNEAEKAAFISEHGLVAYKQLPAD